MPKPMAAPEMAKIKTPPARTWSKTGKRDPFLSPVRTGGPSACAAGRKCLIVDQMVLKGIVKSQEGYIAVVENSAQRAYFLREKDPVFNGVVTKITADSIMFRELVVDRLGKTSSRVVTKRVSAPAV
jgi:Tfp pilus assembly protein PilP